jgi:lysophospholipase L1-like esterase
MKLPNLLVFLAAAALALVLADQGLRFLGYPSTRFVQIAHPKNDQRFRNNVEFRHEFRTNSHGLRYEELPATKASDETRFLLLGDSMTEGYGVEADETFGARLQDVFTRAENRPIRFINGGLTGVGPQAYWRLFYALGLGLEPDVVLVCITYNDVSSMAVDLSVDELYNFEHPDFSDLSEPAELFYRAFPRLYTLLSLSKDYVQRLWDKWTAPKNFVDRVLKVAEARGIPEERIAHWRATLDPELVEANRKGLLGGLILSLPLIDPNLFRESIDLVGHDAEAKFQSLVLLLDEMRRTSEEHGIQLGVIYIPARFQYERSVFDRGHPWIDAGMVRKEWLTEASEIQTRLKQWALTRSVPFLDLTTALRDEIENGNTLNFRLDGHWNADGHLAAATAIRKWIDLQTFLHSKTN